ncbi:MAG: hypothetical protein V1723_01705 [Candidatus Uhrbacteria bacterium]
MRIEAGLPAIFFDNPLAHTGGLIAISELKALAFRRKWLKSADQDKIIALQKSRCGTGFFKKIGSNFRLNRQDTLRSGGGEI